MNLNEMVVILVINVCETLLVNVENHFKQSKRTNAELSDKMHQLFQDNIADYDKFANWYGKGLFINIGGKDEFEQ